DERGEAPRLERRIQQDKDQQQRDWNEQGKTLRCRLEILELTSPLDRPTGWKVHLFYSFLCVRHKRREVAPSNIGLHVDPATDTLAADLGRSLLDADISELRHRDLKRWAVRLGHADSKSLHGLEIPPDVSAE